MMDIKCLQSVLFSDQVVISKLRSNDVHYTVQNINLRAAKALIIIVPLLGITYIITIVGPRKSDNTLATVFILTRTCLIAFQACSFLAPTGAQEMLICVCLFVCSFKLSNSSLSAVSQISLSFLLALYWFSILVLSQLSLISLSLTLSGLSLGAL